jgi:hypothetical protein
MKHLGLALSGVSSRRAQRKIQEVELGLIVHEACGPNAGRLWISLGDFRGGWLVCFNVLHDSSPFCSAGRSFV